MAYRLEPVTGTSIVHAPPVCVGCVFWQSRGQRLAAKGHWAEKIEDDWGAWGTLYRGDGDRLLGLGTLDQLRDFRSWLESAPQST